MLKSRLCDYSDACILIKKTISVTITPAAVLAANNFDKKGTFDFFFFHLLIA